MKKDDKWVKETMAKYNLDYATFKSLYEWIERYNKQNPLPKEQGWIWKSRYGYEGYDCTLCGGWVRYDRLYNHTCGNFP